MFHDRWLARAAAALYLVTWVTSVLALPLYGGSATDSTAGLASRASVLTASVLEVVLALAVVGTSLLLYPLLRPHGPAAAVGYIALRTLEASVILVGVVAVLPAVARPATTASPGLDPAVGAGLHLLHDWTFIVGPGLDRPGFSGERVVPGQLAPARCSQRRTLPRTGSVGCCRSVSAGGRGCTSRPTPWWRARRRPSPSKGPVSR